MTYTASHIANFMLDKADDEARPITNMKLQKLVYIAYGWALAVLDRKLFEEPIEAWDHGPVIPSLYHEFKQFRGHPINERSIIYDLDDNDVCEPYLDAGDEDLALVLGRVWDVYKGFSAWSLRNMAHQDGTPWKQVYNPNVQSKEIPDNLIKPHFEAKIRQYLDDAERRPGATAS